MTIRVRYALADRPFEWAKQNLTLRLILYELSIVNDRGEG